MKKKEQQEEVHIIEVNTGTIDLCLLGGVPGYGTPIILNRMSQKAIRELIFPGKKKTAADKAANLKHDMKSEFRASPYTFADDSAPTFIGFQATAVKCALRNAALDLPGAKKAQIGRLTWVEGDILPLYGVPFLRSDVVRNSDINHTPDVRTRAAIKEWAMRISITFVKPILKEQDVVNLMAAAGLTIGLGDWRPQKGSGNYGQFKIVSPDDENFKRVVATGGRLPQIEAMNNPVAYDQETEELMSWFDAELSRRGFKVA